MNVLVERGKEGWMNTGIDGLRVDGGGEELKGCMDGEREGWVDNKWMHVYGQLVTGNKGRVKDGYDGSWKGKDRWINGIMEGERDDCMDGWWVH